MSELPKGWLNTPLPEIAGITMGQSPDSSDCNDIGIGMPFFQGKAEFQKLYPEVRKYCTKPKKIAKKDDVLLSVRAPVGPTNLAESECVIGRGLAAINSHELAHKYLLYYFRYIEPWLSEQGTGSTFKAIGGQFLKELSVKLAPQAEQTRIVEKLDEVLAQVDTIKARLDGIPAILKRFRQSVLAAAVSGRLTEEWRKNSSNIEVDLVSLNKDKNKLIENKLIKNDLSFEYAERMYDAPDSWAILKLKSVAKKITDGEHKTPIRQQSGRYLISARNVRDGYISLENVDYVDESEYQKLRQRCDPNKGDILISCSGSVGRVSLVDADDKYVMVRSAALVKLLDEYMLNYFLVYALQSPQLQKRIDESSKSTAQSNLFLGPIKELEVPLPPIEEQREIVRLVDQYFAFADTIEAQVKKAQTRVDNLTQSILAKAFRGELVAQDPDDEPAEKLLERIAQARKEAEALAKAAKKVTKTK